MCAARRPIQDSAQSAFASEARIPADHREMVYRLWDELSDFDVASANQALNHLFLRMCRWLKAENAFWIGAVRVMRGSPAARDPMSGWRAGALEVLDTAYSVEKIRKRGLRTLQSAGTSRDPGDTSRALAAQAGKFRVYTLQSGELVDLLAFRQTEHYEVNYRQRGLSDRLWVVFPVNADAEAYYCFDKYGRRRRFSENEVALARHALRGIKWFHRQLLLMHGLGITEKPLAPAERKVLRWLMTDLDERAIAERVGFTQGSVHQYIVTLYRKFGVRSRSALISLWLGRKV